MGCKGELVGERIDDGERSEQALGILVQLDDGLSLLAAK